jgi:murein DD-endopeptidase MepM/ murein hydrolase activator NlpD
MSDVTNHPEQTAHNSYAQPMNYPDTDLPVHDFSKGYHPEEITKHTWSIGKYNEVRNQMYVSEIYTSRKAAIHIGIDIWTEAFAPVYAVADGTLLGITNNNNHLDYGPTLVYEIEFDEKPLYVLYGHLNWDSIQELEAGMTLKKGQKLGLIGTVEENGGWVPHLHMQLSVNKPEKIDMPGVVDISDREEAVNLYPDPQILTGNFY